MQELIHYDTKQLVLAEALGTGLVVPKPFEEDIFLTEFVAAGHTFGLQSAGLYLKEGVRLKLFRDTKNKFDKNSIVLKDKDNNRLGFVPMAKNEIMARLLEAGKELYAVVSQVSKNEDEVVEFSVKIYLGA